MMAQRTWTPGLLVADQAGYYHLHTANMAGCWHYDGPCDGSCAIPDERVAGYKSTNALLPAIARARAMGYTDAKGQW